MVILLKYNHWKFKKINYKPIKWSTLPYEVDHKVGCALQRCSGAALQLQAHVIAVVVRHLDDMTHTRPCLVQFSHISVSLIQKNWRVCLYLFVKLLAWYDFPYIFKDFNNTLQCIKISQNRQKLIQTIVKPIFFIYLAIKI